MRPTRFSSLAMAVLLATAANSYGQAANPAHWDWQSRPTMGWNSWDCYGAGVNEAQAMANADYLEKNLKAHGYTLVTIDIQWYEPTARTETYKAGAKLEMDANGRLLPAPNRFPSTKDARSFKPIADKLHAQGLKFGLHLMRGIPRQAVNENVVILGTEKLKEGGIRAANIANKSDTCPWNTDMYGVDMTKPGAQEYYDSVFAQMAAWDLDFIKVDDLVFNRGESRLHAAEAMAIRKAIDRTGRKIVFSTSPGATPVSAGPEIKMAANQWRVSDDFWDNWPALQSQFKRLHDWEPFRGPGFFPDADMLPVGRLQMWRNENSPTPGRNTGFTRDELYTLMNLWSISRSPLIIGANLPSNDEFTLQLLTNDELIKVNQYSTNNRQLRQTGNEYVWVADAEGSANKYVALFNAPPNPAGRGRGRGAATATAASGPAATTVTMAIEELKLDPMLKLTNVRDIWAHKDLGALDKVSAELAPHASAIFEVQVARK